MSGLATNWDAYYRATPRYTSITRAISTRKIVGLLRDFGVSGAICEIGGANSCFVDAICHDLPVTDYHVVDLNAYGLSLLEKKQVNAKLTWELEDVLKPYGNGAEYDCVFSVGLIEHFGPEETELAVRSHFERCKKGGLVLITFPTPTLLYRAIRRGAESIGKWQFPDERPLEFDEVLVACSGFGEVVHTSINWAIGLTQGYVMVRVS